MLTHQIYYFLKPLIPRSVQISLRRKLVIRKRLPSATCWPIDERAGCLPVGWPGWPEKKRFALVLTHDVDTARGQEKCLPLMELEMGLGFRSSFNFVPKGYAVNSSLRHRLVKQGFEVGVHGLRHKGNLFKNKKNFLKQASFINHYIKEWECCGFRTPSMHHNLEWIHHLEIEYDASTFDTDPFEPQSDGVCTIFPFWVSCNYTPFTLNLEPLSSNLQPPTVRLETHTSNLQPATVSRAGFVELPYTLPQDFTLFVLMKEKSINIWKKKLDWIVECGGMVLLNTHPDYMNFGGKRLSVEEYPANYYRDFLEYVNHEYKGQYWHVLPKELAKFWKHNQMKKETQARIH